LKPGSRRFDSCRPRQGSVAQTVELPALTRGRAGSTPAGAISSILGRTATGAVPRLENGWGASPWGFDSLSFRSARRSRARRASPPGTRRDARIFQEAWPSRQGSALLTRRRETVRRFEPCCLRFRPVAQWTQSSGLRTHRAPVRIGPGRLSRRRSHPRVAQQRRAPLLQRGGWGFESLAADLDVGEPHGFSTVPLLSPTGSGAVSASRPAKPASGPKVRASAQLDKNHHALEAQLGRAAAL
jgi:hypothetical protein